MTREFSREEKIDFMRSLLWDYNIPPEHCLEVLEGKRELAGHYNEKSLFKKIIESFRWFTVLKLMPLNRIYELLTDDLIASLRFKSLSKNYEFIRKQIQSAIIKDGHGLLG
jgi:hypothetical protein